MTYQQKGDKKQLADKVSGNKPETVRNLSRNGFAVSYRKSCCVIGIEEDLEKKLLPFFISSFHYLLVPNS